MDHHVFDLVFEICDFLLIVFCWPAEIDMQGFGEHEVRHPPLRQGLLIFSGICRKLHRNLPQNLFRIGELAWLRESAWGATLHRGCPGRWP